MMSVLVTGANGFVGTSLCSVLSASGLNVVAAVRSSSSNCQEYIRKIVVGNISPYTSWENALNNIDVVVHLASRVHVMDEITKDPLAEYRLINVTATENLARQCVNKGVKRFIFLSSIKVNGEKTDGKPFHPDDIPIPQDNYAVSKLEAEILLRKIEQESDMEVVIIRPPLIYGPGVKGNFLRLLKIVNIGTPLPLGKVSNQRSLVSLPNLCDLVRVCIKNPKAAGRTFLVSDGEDLTTSELLYKLSYMMNKPSRYFRFPVRLIRLAGKMTGKSLIVNRLCDSLQIDITSLKNTFDWTPPFSVDEGLRLTVSWFMQTDQNGK